MTNNSLGCGKRFKHIAGKLKEVVGDCDFICGVANAWGEETFCLKCSLKLKISWAESSLDMWKKRGKWDKSSLVPSLCIKEIDHYEKLIKVLKGGYNNK